MIKSINEPNTPAGDTPMMSINEPTFISPPPERTAPVVHTLDPDELEEEIEAAEEDGEIMHRRPKHKPTKKR